MCCEASCKTAVRHCEQCCVDYLQSDADGKALACADGLGEFQKDWSSIIYRNFEIQFFPEKMDSTFSKTCVNPLHKRNSDLPRGPCGLCTWQEENAIFNGLLFV